ncbi:hypothetical protein EXU57_05995 [Segetibacter sp. 3557_3]|uniref:hypothetical protein n=1 Tax=Segetibacter sp. 3557_3 TaxID=2547429 RepID=UPI001058F121|nr:hypothetical protein [Segetibacter sp. 3557_3]TDH28013.1 hypothetical protein EXU57_05995 [Segetibacter sp. 3557_3]
MDELTPFFVEYRYNNGLHIAEVKPCCQEEDIFYYDVSINNEYQFTITPSSKPGDEYSWRLALKNADKPIDPAMIQLIGEQIDAYQMS